MISIYVLYRAFQAHFQVRRRQIEVIYIQPLTAFAFQMISYAKVRYFSDNAQCLSLEITQMCEFSFFLCMSTINHRAR